MRQVSGRAFVFGDSAGRRILGGLLEELEDVDAALFFEGHARWESGLLFLSAECLAVAVVAVVAPHLVLPFILISCMVSCGTCWELEESEKQNKKQNKKQKTKNKKQKTKNKKQNKKSDTSSLTITIVWSFPPPFFSMSSLFLAP